MLMQQMTEEQLWHESAYIGQLDAQWQAHCERVDKLRKMVLEEPYDSPVWDVVEKYFSGQGSV